MKVTILTKLNVVYYLSGPPTSPPPPLAAAVPTSRYIPSPTAKNRIPFSGAVKTHESSSSPHPSPPLLDSSPSSFDSTELLSNKDLRLAAMKLLLQKEVEKAANNGKAPDQSSLDQAAIIESKLTAQEERIRLLQQASAANLSSLQAELKNSEVVAVLTKQLGEAQQAILLQSQQLEKQKITLTKQTEEIKALTSTLASRPEPKIVAAKAKQVKLNLIQPPAFQLARMEPISRGKEFDLNELVGAISATEQELLSVQSMELNEQSIAKDNLVKLETVLNDCSAEQLAVLNQSIQLEFNYLHSKYTIDLIKQRIEELQLGVERCRKTMKAQLQSNQQESNHQINNLTAFTEEILQRSEEINQLHDGMHKLHKDIHEFKLNNAHISALLTEQFDNPLNHHLSMSLQEMLTAYIHASMLTKYYSYTQAQLTLQLTQLRQQLLSCTQLAHNELSHQFNAKLEQKQAVIKENENTIDRLKQELELQSKQSQLQLAELEAKHRERIHQLQANQTAHKPHNSLFMLSHSNKNPQLNSPCLTLHNTVQQQLLTLHQANRFNLAKFLDKQPYTEEKQYAAQNELTAATEEEEQEVEEEERATAEEEEAVHTPSTILSEEEDSAVTIPLNKFSPSLNVDFGKARERAARRMLLTQVKHHYSNAQAALSTPDSPLNTAIQAARRSRHQHFNAKNSSPAAAAANNSSSLAHRMKLLQLHHR
jgi:hypothetical protein